jgi:hypothetical protein
MNDKFSADNRFTYGPYTKFAYPNQVYYPQYGYQSYERTPYIFRHYLPPTYYEMWDYNTIDLQEARYNEYLQKQIKHKRKKSLIR